MTEKLRQRATLTIRELHQAQQELWALRGAAPVGHSPTDLEQDLIALKKRVSATLGSSETKTIRFRETFARFVFHQKRFFYIF